jgi:hypothetical protein
MVAGGFDRISDYQALETWVGQGIAHTSTLPKKTPKGARARRK